MEIKNEKQDVQDIVDEQAIEEVAYGTQHALNILLELMIDKGIITKQEFLDRLDQDVTDSPEFDEVNIEIPDKGED